MIRDEIDERRAALSLDHVRTAKRPTRSCMVGLRKPKRKGACRDREQRTHPFLRFAVPSSSRVDRNPARMLPQPQATRPLPTPPIVASTPSRTKPSVLCPQPQPPALASLPLQLSPLHSPRVSGRFGTRIETPVLQITSLRLSPGHPRQAWSTLLAMVSGTRSSPAVPLEEAPSLDQRVLAQVSTLKTHNPQRDRPLLVHPGPLIHLID